MALLRAVALGAVSAVALPYLLDGKAGQLGEAVHYGTIALPRGLGLSFSVPIFLGVALFAWIFFKWSDR
ncbi:MAG: hypothetical protein H0W74_09700 [Sphingosinicella sp.]|nr:hypothetical protein [Sphingosinicella sp.]